MTNDELMIHTLSSMGHVDPADVRLFGVPAMECSVEVLAMAVGLLTKQLLEATEPPPLVCR